MRQDRDDDALDTSLAQSSGGLAGSAAGGQHVVHEENGLPLTWNAGASAKSTTDIIDAPRG